MFKYKKIIILLILFLFIFGCTNQKPDNIRDSVWNQCIEYYTEIDRSMMRGEAVSNEIQEKMFTIKDQYTVLTKEESQLFVIVLELLKLNLEYEYANLLKNESLKEDIMKTYMLKKKILKEDFGM